MTFSGGGTTAAAFISIIHFVAVFVLFLKEEEFDEISWKETQEIKNSNERKLNSMESSPKKNPMKLPDQKISSSVI